jgi:hypothetical protein
MVFHSIPSSHNLSQTSLHDTSLRLPSLYATAIPSPPLSSFSYQLIPFPPASLVTTRSPLSYPSTFWANPWFASHSICYARVWLLSCVTFMSFRASDPKDWCPKSSMAVYLSKTLHHVIFHPVLQLHSPWGKYIMWHDVTEGFAFCRLWGQGAIGASAPWEADASSSSSTKNLSLRRGIRAPNSIRASAFVGAALYVTFSNFRLHFFFLLSLPLLHAPAEVSSGQASRWSSFNPLGTFRVRH